MITIKQLEVKITLGSGTFGEDVGNEVTLTGFRMTADLMLPGGDSMGRCKLRVFGLREDVMNQLTTIGVVNTAIKAKNSITLSAGDSEAGMSEVFKGTIYDAWADYSGAPNVAFNIDAYAGLVAALKPVETTSYKGATDVAVIMADLASEMGLELQNNGVSGTLSNPYLPGTTLTKLRIVAAAVGINYVIERDVLAIWPTTGSRAGGVPIVSAETGMVGYPTLSSKGMTVRMMFNPNVRIGGDIQVESTITMAQGTWQVYDLTHNLSSELVGGPWFTIAEVSNVRR